MLQSVTEGEGFKIGQKYSYALYGLYIMMMRFETNSPEYDDIKILLNTSHRI